MSRISDLTQSHGWSMFLRTGFSALIVAILALLGNAQTLRGAINGTVTDQSGAFVPRAQVNATDIATGVKHTTITTTEGQFAFQDVPLGIYKVNVVASGFAPYAVDEV